MQVARSNAEDYSVVLAALQLRILELERGPAVAAAASSSAESSDVREFSPELPARLDRLSVTMQARAARGLSNAFLVCRELCRGYVMTSLGLVLLAWL